MRGLEIYEHGPHSQALAGGNRFRLLAVRTTVHVFSVRFRSTTRRGVPDAVRSPRTPRGGHGPG